MKSKFLFIINLFAVLILTNCITTPKEPRSLEASSDTINLRVARSIIANYDMEVIYDYKSGNFFSRTSPFRDFKITELVIAKNQEYDESVVYASFKNQNRERIQFTYLSIHGEKSSTVKYDANSRGNEYHQGTVILNNNSLCCKLDNKIGYGVLINPDDWTRELVYIRGAVENMISSTSVFIPFTFGEPINPKQMELMNKLLFQIK